MGITWMDSKSWFPVQPGRMSKLPNILLLTIPPKYGGKREQHLPSTAIISNFLIRALFLQWYVELDNCSWTRAAWNAGCVVTRVMSATCSSPESERGPGTCSEARLAPCTTAAATHISSRGQRCLSCLDNPPQHTNKKTPRIDQQQRSGNLQPLSRTRWT